MSIRHKMLKAASRAKISLKDRVELVAGFVKGQLNEDGGFKNRAGRSDLYYTVFGLESLLALEIELPQDKITSYLAQFNQGHSLDFVHMACLVRCWADLVRPVEPDVCNKISQRIENHLVEHATIYTCFLALCAYQDLDIEVKNKGIFLDCIDSLRTADGAYANESDIKIGAAPVTAAALTILHYLNESVPDSAINWLLSCIGPEGGFSVMPQTEPADLLSTATALHALSVAGVPLIDIGKRCIDFIDGLWVGSGGFCASSADRTPDCEYTYYALLAMGHLS